MEATNQDKPWIRAGRMLLVGSDSADVDRIHGIIFDGSDQSLRDAWPERHSYQIVDAPEDGAAAVDDVFDAVLVTHKVSKESREVVAGFLKPSGWSWFESLPGAP